MYGAMRGRGDLAIRNLTYRLFVERGHAARDDVAVAAGVPAATITAAWTRLHDEHTIVLDAETNELRMASPFSAVPTPFRVHTAGRSWYANCAWDTFGICAALHTDDLIETTCADCGDPIRSRSVTSGPMTSAAVPLPRAGRRLVGRHRVHLKHDEPLPVGRARGPLARRSPARCHTPGHHALRARPRLVGRPARPQLATPLPRREPGHPRPASGSPTRSGAYRDAPPSGCSGVSPSAAMTVSRRPAAVVVGAGGGDLVAVGAGPRHERARRRRAAWPRAG